MPTLHITNGDSTVALLKDAKIKGDMLPWRDILHMGPVSKTESIDALSQIRASYLASLGWGELTALNADFRKRDQTLVSANNFDKILLWFEHDLYDQLQILQLFDWFNQHADMLPKLYLINPNKHLGHHNVDEVLDLLAQQHKVTQEQLSLATLIWNAYRQPTPELLVQHLTIDMTSLPFLKPALLRTLAELPSADKGLSQTEHSILYLINENNGGLTRFELFKKYSVLEEATFHGDMGFFWYLDQLKSDSPTLLLEENSKLSITSLGASLLTSTAFWHREYRKPHWLGGYEISKKKSYYWDAEKRQLLHTNSRGAC